MATPATPDAFVALVRKSGMVDVAQLDSYLKNLGAAGPRPDTPRRLARRMVEDGVLTIFQAEQFLKGRYHGFAIGNYRILERIAHGGMGTIYLAEHVHMARRMAVKVLPHDLAKNPPVLERFYREARVAAALQHPNLVRATDVDCKEGTHYLVLDYVDGVNLQNLVERKGPLLIERAAHYIGQAARGLQYAHQVAGLIHRDIKPANLMLDRTGTIRILDLGLARMHAPGFFNAQADEITRKHNDQNVLGTADYIAPEQALDSQDADTRADVYSLGATFYFLLTGSPPFPEGTLTQKLMAHQLRQPAPVRSLRPDVPEEIAALIARMMTKRLEHRPQTQGEVTAALAKWLALPLSPPADDEIPSLCAAVLNAGAGGIAPGADTSQAGARADTEPPAKKPAAPAPPLRAPAAMPAARVPLRPWKLWQQTRSWWSSLFGS